MKTVTALALALAVFVSGTHQADAHFRKKGATGHHRYSKGVKPQVRGYIARGGGYAAGYEPEAPLLPFGNSPNYDTRTFWERVQGNPFDNQAGVSAF